MASQRTFSADGCRRTPYPATGILVALLVLGGGASGQEREQEPPDHDLVRRTWWLGSTRCWPNNGTARGSSRPAPRTTPSFYGGRTWI